MSRTAIAAVAVGLVMLVAAPFVKAVWDQDALLDHLDGPSTSAPVQP